MELGKYDLFLLDFDGLLVDTEPFHYEAYRLTLNSFNLILPWSISEFCAIAHINTEFFKKTLRTQFPSLQSIPWDELYAVKKEHYQHLIEQKPLNLMPGAAEFLQFIHDKPHAVVTHSPLKQIQTIRSKIPNLQSIPHWFTREDYQNPKPAPDGYLHALKTLNGKHPIGFEDSLRGYQSLQSANIPAVLIRPSYYPPTPLPSYPSFFDLQAK